MDLDEGWRITLCIQVTLCIPNYNYTIIINLYNVSVLAEGDGLKYYRTLWEINAYSSLLKIYGKKITKLENN